MEFKIRDNLGTIPYRILLRFSEIDKQFWTLLIDVIVFLAKVKIEDENRKKQKSIFLIF